METLRNPLLASVPCGRVRGTPLRVGVLTLMTLVATLLAFPDDEPPATQEAVAPANVSTDAAGEPAAVEAVPPVPRPEVSPPDAKPTRGIRLGLAVALILFGSCLLHELVEASIASRAGGDVAAIVLWPVGGRTVVTELDGAGWMQAALAGPAVHTVLCVLSLPAVVAAGATDAFSPLSLPAVFLDGATLVGLGLLIFSVNLKLLIVNLLPVSPMDGSRLIRGWRLTNSETGLEEPMTVGRWAMGGLAGGMSLTAFGIALGNAWVTAVGALVMACACTEVVAFMPSSRPPSRDETGAGGYDFSQGYTSLERDFEDSDDDREPAEPQLGFFARRRAEREAKRRQQEADERLRAERELDRLLAKVGEVGMKGLTAEETNALTKLSERLKSGR